MTTAAIPRYQLPLMLQVLTDRQVRQHVRRILSGFDQPAAEGDLFVVGHVAALAFSAASRVE